MKKIEITRFYWQFNGNTEVVDFLLLRGHRARPSFHWMEIKVEQPGRKGKLSFCFRHEIHPFETSTDPFLNHIRSLVVIQDCLCQPTRLSNEGPWFTGIFPFCFAREGDNSSLAMRLFRDAMDYLKIVPPDNWGFPAAVVTQHTEVEMKKIRIPFGTFKSAQYYPVVCPLYDRGIPHDLLSTDEVGGEDKQKLCYLCGTPLSKIPRGGDRGYEWHHPFGPTFSINPPVGDKVFY